MLCSSFPNRTRVIQRRFSERHDAARQLTTTAAVAALALTACAPKAPPMSGEADWFVDRADETGLRF